MDKSKLLDQAKELVTKDRNQTHGEAENNFALVAAYWSVHLGQTIDATDVAILMTMFKLARAKHNRSNPENWIDGIGYLACGGEIATKDPF
ncbi:hypothetical protein UFOVP847_13 [uncultured Caudovirales phage]|uniref:DUF6378 domain-containing protein n=1 Tax=uncultured Caudovirales phage TaxID=2100421 RepID=A0A6J5P2W7_9CAUD|nr:hypothetical protein UFOVP847_13 [uncultured Caudovirales phage]